MQIYKLHVRSIVLYFTHIYCEIISNKTAQINMNKVPFNT